MKYLQGGAGIRRVIATALTVILVVASASFGSSGDVRQRYNELSKYMNRTRGLTLSILKKIKEIDKTYRTDAGEPIRPRIPAARQSLSVVQLLVTSFEENGDYLEKELVRFKRDFTPEERSSYESHLLQLNKDLAKYRKAVDKTWGRATGDFGTPDPQSPFAAPLAGGGKFSITGEAGTLLGLTSYERPNVNPEYEASTTDFELGARAKWVPNEMLNVDGHFSRRSTVQRREIGLTDIGATASLNLSSEATAALGFNYSGYGESDADLNDFKDLAVFGRASYQGPGIRGNVFLQRLSRSYSEEMPLGFFVAPLSLDYSVTTMRGNASIPAGLGLVRARLTYEKKSNDFEVRNHTNMNPSVVWELTPGGSELGLDYQSLSHPNDGSGLDSSIVTLLGGSIDDQRRIKAHYLSKSREVGKVKEYGPSVAMYSFPDNDDRNFTDIKFTVQTRSSHKGYANSGFTVVYRLYSGEGMFDFAQLEWRQNANPSGSGRYKSFNIALRYYTEASNQDDSLSLGTMHPAHTADLFWRFGWVRSGTGTLRRLSFGPVVGSKVYVDTERNDAFDSDLLDDVNYIFPNPQNNIRAGMDANVGIVTNNGMTIDGQASYQKSFLYAADPTRTTDLFDLRIRCGYRINAAFLVDGQIDFHKTAASVNAASDLNRSGVRVQLRYLFDVRR
ncbi:MAG: hypothetical protein KKA42_14730 [candidate division Zixibacteria bacterium]|nr:hypothetical protein [candidate division Zixibacteria bacterium]